MKTRKKLAAYKQPAEPEAHPYLYDGSPPGKANSLCSRCGGRSPVGVSLCLSCQGEMAKLGADYARAERDRKAVVRERKKTMGW